MTRNAYKVQIARTAVKRAIMKSRRAEDRLITRSPAL